MITIVKPSLRDATYIGANLREADRHELECQCAPGLSTPEIATQIALASPLSWIAHWHDQPIAAFGAAPQTYVVWSLWTFGTRHLWRAIPAISKHFWDHGDELMAHGCRRLEVRAWKGHDRAPLWLRAVGCTYVTDLSDHGRSGEAFELWEWTATDYLDGSMQARRTGDRRHVLRQNPRRSETQTAIAATDQS